MPSGAFNSSTFDQGFAIQDRTGGIYVSEVTGFSGQFADSFEVDPRTPSDIRILN